MFNSWTITMTFTEDGDKTRADAILYVGDVKYHGWGLARRNPVDPDVPKIGEELAAARALSRLSHDLIDAAADEIELREGGGVRLHL